jgi:N-acetyl-anhydromuramyl-L-alanine amidase AmpD
VRIPAWLRAATILLCCGAVLARAEDLPPEPAIPGSEAGARNPWSAIVIHHSASRGGNASQFDRLHRAKGWDCVGYHFVITNGSGGPDGEIQSTARWLEQKHGAHAGALPARTDPSHRNAYNEFGIGICVVGNFESRSPTRRQLDALCTLVGRLKTAFEIPAHQILGHRHVRGTACPGKRFPWRELFARLQLPTPSHLQGRRTAATVELCHWCRERAGEPVTGSASDASVLPPPILLQMR